MDCGAVSRRDFVRLAALGTASALCPYLASGPMASAALAETSGAQLSDHEALAYEKLSEKRVRCVLCPRECQVADRERGFCGVRENQGGVYKTLVHSRPCSAHVDPIEKKPLFHFLPGSKTFSIATAGCNVECKFCQNWRISQFRPEQVESAHCPPSEIARLARRTGCSSIAYTYSEPVVFYEYVLDCAVEGNKAGVRSVMITNGYINPEPMKDLCSVLSAVKVDLKAFMEKFYQKQVSGELKPVLETLELLRDQGMYTEIVVLLIPGLNHGAGEIEEMAGWVRKNLGADVPLHFTRFWPAYKMTNLSPTPVQTLERAHRIAREQGIHYVYVGNVQGHEYENTFCHDCGKKIISRYGYYVLDNHVSGGKCSYCQGEVPGVWEA